MFFFGMLFVMRVGNLNLVCLGVPKVSDRPPIIRVMSTYISE